VACEEAGGGKRSEGEGEEEEEDGRGRIDEEVMQETIWVDGSS
jgi:hypothetical protein